MNDDCLSAIFSCLPFTDRVRVERVCKRWRSVIFKNSWTNLKSLTSQMLIEKSLNHLNKMQLDLCIFALFKRSGKYLRVLDLNTVFFADFNITRMLRVIVKNCSNLQSLIIYGRVMMGDTDVFMNKIFSNNKKLTTIAIPNFIIHGYCLKSLNASYIYRLEIQLNQICCRKELREIFKNFKNLRVFSLHAQADQIDIILENLGGKILENLKIHRQIDFKPEIQPNYDQHLDKMPRLDTLNLYYVLIKSTFLTKKFQCNLKKLSLSYFEIEDYENFLKALKNLIKLEEIKLSSERTPCPLNDDLFISLQKCINLKYIEIRTCPNITDEGIIALNVLPKFKLLILQRCVSVNAENIFRDLKNAKLIKIDKECKIN